MEGVGVAVVKGGNGLTIGRRENVWRVTGGEIWEVGSEDGDGCRYRMREASVVVRGSSTGAWSHILRCAKEFTVVRDVSQVPEALSALERLFSRCVTNT